VPVELVAVGWVPFDRLPLTWLPFGVPPLAVGKAGTPLPTSTPEPEPEPALPAGPEPSTMAELLAEQDADIRSFKHGDVVEGTVVRIDRDEILVDIGAKSEIDTLIRELTARGQG